MKTTHHQVNKECKCFKINGIRKERRADCLIHGLNRKSPPPPPEYSWERQFRVDFTAPIVDWANRDELMTGELNEILIRQIAFISKTLNEERERIIKEIEEILQEDKPAIPDPYKQYQLKYKDWYELKQSLQKGNI